MRVPKLVGIIFSALVLLLVGRVLWVRYGWEAEYRLHKAVAEVKSSSDVARWWRCKGVARSLLGEAGHPWKIRYSWLGGMGPGEVSIGLTSKGEATVRSKHNGQADWTTRQVALSQKEIDGVARVIDESGLLCQSSERRDGYTVLDIGRYVLRIEAEGSVRELVIDGCHTIPDTLAFSEFFKELEKYKDRLGEVIDWGPYATASVPGSCTNQDADKLLEPTLETNAAQQ